MATKSEYGCKAKFWKSTLAPKINISFGEQFINLGTALGICSIEVFTVICYVNDAYKKGNFFF